MTGNELRDRIGGAIDDAYEAREAGMWGEAERHIRDLVVDVLTEAALRVRGVDMTMATFRPEFLRDRCETVLHDMRKALEGEEINP